MYHINITKGMIKGFANDYFEGAIYKSLSYMFVINVYERIFWFHPSYFLWSISSFFF